MLFPASAVADMGDTIGEGEAAHATEVAIGEGSMLVLFLVALRAAKEPMAARERNAAASHMPPFLV